MDDLTPTGDPSGAETEGAGLGDADLVAQVRDGHDEPYAELYRRHQPAALALARSLTGHTSADDVVSEAFEKLLQRIRGGGGPEAAFRPYLLRTVRTVAVDASRRTRRLVVTEDPEDTARSTPTEGDELVEGVHERTTLARAFAALPERWQTFLWLSFVDDADRAEIATILGINLGSVSALGYRAREGLRRAYLDAHLQDAPTPECSQVWPLLAGSVRGGLGPTQQVEVDQHLARCDHCRAAAAELEAVNSRFGAVLAPIVLGAAAPAYLAAVKTGDSAASAAGAAGAITGDGPGAASEVAGAAAAPTGAAGAVDVGARSLFAGLGSGLGKVGVAVVACTSTVALLVVLAVLNAPHGSEPTVAPRPGSTTSDAGEASSDDHAKGTDATGEPLATDGSTDGSSSPGDPSPSATDDPSTSGTPTTGAATATTTGGPSGTPTFTTTANPTGPTGGPTSSPTTRPPTPSGTRPPTASGTLPPTASPSPTPSTSPTPNVPTQSPSESPSEPPTQSPTQSPTVTPAGPREVDAGLGPMLVQARSQSSAPAHIEIPVRLQGGTADLQISVTVVGLNKFTLTSGPGEGAWGCLAVTPMAGAGKTAVVRCTLRGAAPGDPLALGLDLGYAGDGSVRAVLDVLSPALDADGSDNAVAADLPTRQV